MCVAQRGFHQEFFELFGNFVISVTRNSNIFEACLLKYGQICKK